MSTIHLQDGVIYNQGWTNLNDVIAPTVDTTYSLRGKAIIHLTNGEVLNFPCAWYITDMNFARIEVQKENQEADLIWPTNPPHYKNQVIRKIQIITKEYEEILKNLTSIFPNELITTILSYS